MSVEAEVNSGQVPNIPDHQMVRRIGKGAYGEVWLARNALGTYRGVKIVRRSTFADDRPFQRELNGIQSFEPISRSHPGFVSILQVGPKDATSYFYYVMEVADDVQSQQRINPETYAPRTLHEDIHHRGPLPLSECLHVGVALSAALSHLHQQGLIHRDIKASNVIFINDTPRLADVGLVSTVRERSSCVGTYGFIPNEGPGTVSADIYGLGKVLYQILTGFAVDQFPSLPTQVVESDEWPRFSGLNNVILKACAATARERYASAEELHKALLALYPSETTGDITNNGAPALPTPRTRRVALFCKPNAEPEGRLLQLLRQRLVAQGALVFFDQHLCVGVEWARGIEHTIRTADAVVFLFSPASVQSEMLAYELEVAHQAAQQQEGRPLRLPVRVGLSGPWPKELQPFLEPLTDLFWDGSKDDERLAKEVARALDATQKAPHREARPRLEPTGGAVDLASNFYVVRPTDDAFRDAVKRCDSIVLVKGARQMGKTSLLARGLSEARQVGARVALSDFQKLSLKDLESAEAFFRALAGLLVDHLDLPLPPNSAWDKRRSPNSNFERFLRREILGKLPGRLVWGLDEVDRLFTCSFGSEVFGLFRAWHNERALDPSGPWSRLTLAIAYATEAHLFITDVNQSPFNVGTRLDLEDFSYNQVLDLNERHGTPLQNDTDLRRFHKLLGGQPYLVRRAFNELAAGHVRFDALLATADSDEGIFGDHLRRMLVMLAKDPTLTEIVRGTLKGQPCLDVASFYRLRSGGLLRGDSLGDAQLRCEIYSSYLKRHLV